MRGYLQSGEGLLLFRIANLQVYEGCWLATGSEFEVQGPIYGCLSLGTIAVIYLQIRPFSMKSPISQATMQIFELLINEVSIYVAIFED